MSMTGDARAPAREDMFRTSESGRLQSLGEHQSISHVADSASVQLSIPREVVSPPSNGHVTYLWQKVHISSLILVHLIALIACHRWHLTPGVRAFFSSNLLSIASPSVGARSKGQHHPSPEMVDGAQDLHLKKGDCVIRRTRVALADGAKTNADGQPSASGTGHAMQRAAQKSLKSPNGPVLGSLLSEARQPFGDRCRKYLSSAHDPGLIRHRNSLTSLHLPPSPLPLLNAMSSTQGLSAADFDDHTGPFTHDHYGMNDSQPFYTGPLPDSSQSLLFAGAPEDPYTGLYGQMGPEHQWSGPSLLEELFDGPGTAMSNIEDNYPPFPFHEAKPTPLLSVPQININTSLASPYMSGLLPSQSPMQNTPGRISPSAPGYTPSPSHSFHSPPTPAGPMYSPYPQSSLQSSPMTAHPTMVPSSAWSTPERPRDRAYSNPVPVTSGHRGPMVPQKRYKPHTSSDRRRYVEEVQLEEPIPFFMLKPEEEGIPLVDAMHNRFARLVGRDDQMFADRGPSISVRINWPGYPPWSRQIPTRDFRNPPGPITRAKLAKNVAKSVLRFIQEHKDRVMEEDGDVAWKVGGSRAIELNDLVLVRLDHVSKGSWQAQLQLLRPRPRP